MTQIRENLTVPLTDIQQQPSTNRVPCLRQAAVDLNTLLNQPDNADLGRDMPAMLAAYSQSVDSACNRLLYNQTRMAQDPDNYQAYLSLTWVDGKEWGPPARMRAVGSSALMVITDAPQNDRIDPASPNLSLFVAQPYRHQGIGTFAMSHLLHKIEADFGGQAWTTVNQENYFSQVLVTRAGFEPVGEGERYGQPVIEYAYVA